MSDHYQRAVSKTRFVLIVAAVAASVTATATYGDFKRFGISTSTTFKH